VDSWSDNPVLPEHPYMLLKKKKVADLPWIVSYTASEGLFPTSCEFLGIGTRLVLPKRFSFLQRE
jgi:hypothetical protein